jgi:hypothetical protein
MEFLQTNAFAPRVGETFDMALGEATAPLTLVEIRPLPVSNFPGMVRSPFALIFRSASPVVLPQKIYRLNNQTMGAVDIFIVPIGRDTAGVIYEAVFN